MEPLVIDANIAELILQYVGICDSEGFSPSIDDRQLIREIGERFPALREKYKYIFPARTLQGVDGGTTQAETDNRD